MNKQAFLALLQHPEAISSADLAGLEEVIQNFPYFQAAHILAAKGAKDQGNMLSEQKVRKAAAYSADRKTLKKLLQPADLVPAAPAASPENSIHPSTFFHSAASSELSAEEKQSSFFETIGGAVPDASPAALPEKPAEPEKKTEIQDKGTSSSSHNPTSASLNVSGAKEPSVFFEELQRNLQELHEIKAKLAGGNVKKDLSTGLQVLKKPQESFSNPRPVLVEEVPAPVTITHPAKKETKTENTLLPEPIKEHNSEEDLFSSRLDEVCVAEPAGNDRHKAVDEKELLLDYLSYLESGKKSLLERKKTEDIIDRFIKEDPSIPYLDKSSLPEQSEDKASESYKLKSTPVSENMAKIFALQGKKDKAIEIYNQLMLKNPEKKAYFASQIEKLNQK